MTTPSVRERVRATRIALTGVAEQLAVLRSLDDDDLRARFEAEFGLSAKGRSVQRMLRRLAFKVQADAEGGLRRKALDRIAALEPAHRAPARAAAPRGGETPTTAPETAAVPLTPPPGAQASDRDPRLPPPGTIIRRRFKGATHEVLVGWDDFGWDGRTFGSLTALAREISGSRWNGFGFFKAALAEAREGQR